MSPPDPTERLVFREMAENDLEAMSDLLGDPDVMAFYATQRTAQRRSIGSGGTNGCTWNAASGCG